VQLFHTSAAPSGYSHASSVTLILAFEALDHGGVWHYMPYTYSPDSVGAVLADAAPSRDIPSFPADLHDVSIVVAPARFTQPPDTIDPRVQYAQSIAPTQWPADLYEGPHSFARKGKGAILVSFAGLLAVALGVAIHQLIWKRVAATPAAEYGQVQEAAGTSMAAIRGVAVPQTFSDDHAPETL
jgi:hypothetical protein